LIFDDKNLITGYALPVEKPKIKISEVTVYESDLRNKLKLLLLGQKFSQQEAPQPPSEEPGVVEPPVKEEPSTELWEEVKEAADNPPPAPVKEEEVPADINQEILRLMKKYRSEKDPKKKEEIKARIAHLKKLKEQKQEETPQPQSPTINPEHQKLLEEVNNLSEGFLIMAVVKNNRELFLQYSQGKIDKDKVLKEGKIIILTSKGLSEEEARSLVGD